MAYALVIFHLTQKVYARRVEVGDLFWSHRHSGATMSNQIWNKCMHTHTLIQQHIIMCNCACSKQQTTAKWNEHCFFFQCLSLSLSLCVSFFRSTFTLSLSRVELAPNCIYWTKTKYNSNEYDTTVFTIYTRIVQCLWISWMWCDRCVRTFAQNTLGFVDTGAVGHPHHIHTIGFVWMFRFTSKKKKWVSITYE